MKTSDQSDEDVLNMSVVWHEGFEAGYQAAKEAVYVKLKRLENLAADIRKELES